MDVTIEELARYILIQFEEESRRLLSEFEMLTFHALVKEKSIIAGSNASHALKSTFFSPQSVARDENLMMLCGKVAISPREFPHYFL